MSFTIMLHEWNLDFLTLLYVLTLILYLILLFYYFLLWGYILAYVDNSYNHAYTSSVLPYCLPFICLDILNINFFLFGHIIFSFSSFFEINCSIWIGSIFFIFGLFLKHCKFHKLFHSMLFTI